MTWQTSMMTFMEFPFCCQRDEYLKAMKENGDKDEQR